jgi:threonyl-tRNA synthetase
MFGMLWFHDYLHGVGFSRPFWLSPRQAIVIPVAPPFDDYAKKVRDKMIIP